MAIGHVPFVVQRFPYDGIGTALHRKLSRTDTPSRPASTERSLIVDLTDVTLEGDAIAHSRDGLTIAVEGGIPGERVEVRLRSAAPGGGRSVRGEIVRIITASPHRVTPGCRYFGPCGGCTWQHIVYAEQLRLKQRLCEALLQRALGRDAPLVDPTRAATDPGVTPWGYRNKVHFVFTDRGGEIATGHYRRRSTSVLPVDDCPVHASDGNALAFALRDELRAARVAPASADLRRGTARHVVVRAAARTPERMVTLVVRRIDPNATAAAARTPDAAGQPDASVHVNLHDGDDRYLFGPTTKKVRGRERLREEVAGTSFLISPTAFFQTNAAAADALVALVLTMVPSSASTVLDLYAGVGLFALPLARRGHRVTAVEESAEAVADGLASQRLNGLDPRRCRFIAGRVEDAIKSPRLPREIDVVVLDPPRSGCEPRALRHVLARVRPKRLVYVSCNPAALADDLVVARGLGYRADRVRPIDMFPHTSHVETVTVLMPVRALR